MKTLLFSESPYLSIITIIIILLSLFFKNKLAIYTSVCILFLLICFYRMPNRELTNEQEDDKIIIAPCDGKIMNITKDYDYYKICVFLSVLDVHTQSYPISGKILRSEHKPGEFNVAFSLEKSDKNERYITEIENNKGKVRVDQIAGLLARRIVNISEVNSEVTKGDYMGMIKLSSRVDIYLPVQKVELLVKENQSISGNIDTIARWKF